MARYHTSVSLDTETVDKIRQYGISVSSFARNAIEAVLTDGFEDYLTSLKVKLIEDKLSEVQNEMSDCKARIDYLREQEATLKELHSRAVEEQEFAMTVGKLSLLLQRLNKEIILNNFDAEKVAIQSKGLILDIIQLNPGFSLETHMKQLQAALR